ncbi:carbon catabolite repressor protein 4 homolog 6 [Amborella trichopoda]|nr:carbon catabolite repressor protein 4 homolog 6 [Amborella trichopoda]|eukprot:XP_006854929.2 carbon catabolite repressor protein 4 homolog 6 [Amborella trichopoda]
MASSPCRPSHGGGRRGGWRGQGRWFCNSPKDNSIVSGDSHFRAVRLTNYGFRHGERGGGGYRNGYYSGDPRPNFRPIFRPRGPSPQSDNYRHWEHALSQPPSHCEKFVVLSFNILADYLARDHRHKLYFHIPPHILDWEWRKRRILLELGLWSPDIMCLQEVDKFQDLAEELQLRGFAGIWKERTGLPIDGCAIFWRLTKFNLLHEEYIEFNKLSLRDNVAQICVLESRSRDCVEGGNRAPSTSLSKPKGANKVVVCNIHVLYNPNRGDIKLGQVRVLLNRAQEVSNLWDDAPVIICGDFNCTPKSPLYKFISEQKLSLSGLAKNQVSGQFSARLYDPMPNFNRGSAPNFSSRSPAPFPNFSQGYSETPEMAVNIKVGFPFVECKSSLENSSLRDNSLPLERIDSSVQGKTGKEGLGKQDHNENQKMSDACSEGRSEKVLFEGHNEDNRGQPGSFERFEVAPNDNEKTSGNAFIVGTVDIQAKYPTCTKASSCGNELDSHAHINISEDISVDSDLSSQNHELPQRNSCPSFEVRGSIAPSTVLKNVQKCDEIQNLNDGQTSFSREGDCRIFLAKENTNRSLESNILKDDTSPPPSHQVTSFGKYISDACTSTDDIVDQASIQLSGSNINKPMNESVSSNSELETPYSHVEEEEFPFAKSVFTNGLDQDSPVICDQENQQLLSEPDSSITEGARIHDSRVEGNLFESLSKEMVQSESADEFILELSGSDSLSMKGGASNFQELNTASSLQSNVDLGSVQVLEDPFSIEPGPVESDTVPYDPFLWTSTEIEAATGNAECTLLEHNLKLKSAYTEVEDYSGTKDTSREPQVTSYNRRFMGTVDYIWCSEGLQTVKVLGTLPKHVLQRTRGFPTQKWGSDHLALACQLAFTDGLSGREDA